MPGFNRPQSDEAAFIQRILNEIKRDLPTSHVVPTWQNDPPATNPTNLWMRADGRLRGRYWNGSAYVYVDYPMRADIAGVPAVPASPAPPAKPAVATSQKLTSSATWSQTYQGDGDKRTDSKGNNYLVYGNSGSDSFNGTQRALIGFDYAAIASAISGSTIKKIQLKMTNVHAYWNSGVQIYLGMHNVTSEPASWPGSGSLLLRKSAHYKFGKPQTKTVTLPISFATNLRAGTGKGLAIEAPSGSRDYYGFAAGVGSGYTVPQLIITYTK